MNNTGGQAMELLKETYVETEVSLVDADLSPEEDTRLEDAPMHTEKTGRKTGRGRKSKDNGDDMEDAARVLNECRLLFPSLSANEGYARACAAAFCAQCDPTATELSDIKCAVSEAVTNAIVHGYRDSVGEITMILKLLPDRVVKIEIRDKGCGMADVEQAKTPLYTTDPAGERSGMGFTVMESFMDTLRVLSTPGKGTKVTMTKKMSFIPRSRR